VPVDAILAFEQALYQYADARGGQVLAEIRDKKDLTPELRKQMDELITGAKAEFMAARSKAA
jgi:F0F1-type ATP synthase alpha subunit